MMRKTNSSAPRRRLFVTIWLLLAVGWPEVAWAGDSWSTPFVGVKYLRRTTSKPQRIHALVVDLCAAGVSLRATASSERKRKTSSFGALVGAEAAVNGDFFSFSSYGTTGLAVGAGQVWSGSSDKSWSGFLGFGRDRAYLDPEGSTVSPLPRWLQQAVSGRPQVLKAGTVVSSYTASVCKGGVRHPRTGAGLSQDRRTLYLVVVDGRWSQSVGASCAEVGQILKSLGAYDGLNLDGGGSSTMWLRGKGVVNHPSDGSERTVANHLAVHARGSGAPGSCDYTLEELSHQSAVYGAARGSTDIDGDGKADACARSSAGVRCNLSASSSASKVVLGPPLSDSSGWADPTNYATLRFGDLNGDGKADLCARENRGLRCWLSGGSGFAQSITGPGFDDKVGYNLHRFYTTLRLADITGDGKDDVCIRAAARVYCYPSTGTGFGARMDGPPLSDAAGWGEPQYHGSIRLGDLDGDGRADLCARGPGGVSCWLATGKGFAKSAITGPTWSDAVGWGWLQHWSTMRLADVTGDGKADLCARSASYVYCYPSTGKGFGSRIRGPKLATGDGWWAYKYFSTLRLADITGDGKADLCIRGPAGLRCWPSTGKGFGAMIDTGLLSDAAGWGAAHYFQTIRLADITGDGKADLCARGSAGVSCWPSTGKGFGAKQSGPGWASSVGWDAPAYYSTIRLAGPRCHPKPEVCDGKDNNCNGQVDEGGVCAKKDGGVAPRDGAPKGDGPAMPIDGSGPKSDGPAPTRDGARPRQDGAPPAPDGTGPGVALSGGCGCQLGPREAPLLPLLALLLLALRTRRWGGR